MQNPQTVIPKQKWDTFTYIGKETIYITKIFKHSNIKVAYRTNNTIQDNLTPKTRNHNKLFVCGSIQINTPRLW